MAWLRASVRLVLMLSVTTLLFVLWTVGRPFGGLRWRSWVYRRWARGMCRISGMRRTIRGDPPPAPCVIVSNHLSYMDIVLIASHVDVVFVSKAEVARWPFVGMLARSVGTIFVERDVKRRLPEVNALIHAALDRGERVALFPEGTSSGGESVRPFRASLLEPAASSRYPVYCAALGYGTPPGEPPASQAVCWWGDMTFADHVFRLLRMSHFSASLELGPDAHREANRKELAQETWRSVAAMHARSS